jgi:uncharacterized surface protein with fasciclin (FAS1) repeats
MDCLFGAYPGANDTHTSADVSVLNAVDFLQSYTALGASTNGQTPTFSTFLAALKTTGLSDTLANGGSYMLFAPTDAAFAALPKDTLAAFMADPTALGDLLRSHIVEGYFPAGSLGTNGPTGGFNRTVTTMRGTNLVLTGGEDLIVNGKTVGGGGDYTMAANGTRLFWISKLNLPVTQPTAIASPPITQPATPAAPPPATPQITAVAEIPKTGAGGQQPILRELSLVILAALTLLLIGGLLWRRATHQ